MKIDDDIMSSLMLTWDKILESSNEILATLKGVQGEKRAERARKAGVLLEEYDGGSGDDDFDADVSTLEDLMKETSEIMKRFGIYC